jgi:chorismate mutase
VAALMAPPPPPPRLRAAPGGGDFGPKYQAHVGELQRQLDEARAALEAKDQQLGELLEQRQAMADELAVLKGMGGGGITGSAAAAELAALDLSGGDEKAMKAIEQRIGAVLAEKAAMEAKVARMESQHKQELDALKVVSLLLLVLLAAAARRLQQESAHAS